ncbi:rnd efflux pump membrane fusion protein barrel-sandwich domain [Lucifera butyrica]|uniref:Rnd efflux pump membrane fusion protein barrel-sandwich domain n=1 Tax=Lucifera butyrica TaxID=1351585 RepID=A0A498R6G8_9FIRM|nr:efflux RND transporter periplasmic adaptor subunit [Lucifera butyrica]VBB06467.1 rnd efflux pump membrane fusion protein barrel-sandwich domain [Lucifera butyrica]
MAKVSKKWLAGVIALLIVALAAGLVIKKKHDLAGLAKPAVRPTPVQVAESVNGTVPVTVHYLGKADSMVTADIAARITSNILAIHQREGDMVKAGQLMVELDDATLSNKVRAAGADQRAAESTLAAAESAYSTQKASFDRDEILYQNKAISQEAYEHAKSALDLAESQVQAARQRVALLAQNKEAAVTEKSYTQLVAPFDGIVVKRSAEPGDLAVPGKPLLTLQALNQGYKIIVQIPQEQTLNISAGTHALISDGKEQTEAAVAKVYPALAANSLATVEICLDKIPFQLPPGSTLGVDFILKDVSGIIVPAAAVVKNTTGAFVIGITDGTAHHIPVNILGENDKQAVVSGIDAGAEVAVGQESQMLKLMDGMPVTVAADGSEQQ